MTKRSRLQGHLFKFQDERLKEAHDLLEKAHELVAQTPSGQRVRRDSLGRIMGARMFVRMLDGKTKR